MKFTAALLVLALAPAIALSAPASEENATGKPKPDPVPIVIWGTGYDNDYCAKGRYTRTYKSHVTQLSITPYPGTKGFINKAAVVLHEDRKCGGNGVKFDVGGCAHLGGKDIGCIAVFVHPPSE